MRKTFRSVRRLAKSSAFRLTMLYMVLFGGSAAVLLVFIYLATTREMEAQIKNSVSVQVTDLARSYNIDGPEDTIASINHLVHKDRGRNFVYLLMTGRKIVAGNLDRWPGETWHSRDWLTFTLDATAVGEDRPAKVLAYAMSLGRGDVLLVGYKMQSAERLREITLRVLLLSVIITFAMAVLGGLIFSRYLRRRIDSINRTCQSVISGSSFSGRVPVSGSGDEFDLLAENFNAMLSRVGELVEGIRDISYNVAHDLRTPLGRVRNRLERIESTYNPPTRVTGEIRAATAEIDELLSTFSAILRIAQAEAGAGAEHFTELDLSALVEDVVDLYAALAEEKGVSLFYRIDESLTLKGDRHLFTQAFANLVDNAIKYTPSGGRVEVALVGEPHRITLSVADNGPGVPPEFWGRITEKFFRMESSRTSPGSGLGLSLASAAFRLHGGTLTFEDNQPGLRATVTFTR